MAESRGKTSLQPDEASLVGRQLGDFRIVRRLGAGAMAEVYLAEQGSLKRQVAFKVLKSHLASDATYLERFQNEARAAASLVHANIVQIHDVGCIDGIQYIAQEYVPGVNLQQLMDRRGLPDLKLALSIMRQVAKALHKASEQGIVHRDIKPENIMITRAGEVKVADFGLARQRGGNELTQVGVTMGTPLYMSPEQVEGRALDTRSDIYSFGITAYQMLTGKLPFRGDTPLNVAVQHLTSQAEPIQDLRPDLPEAVCKIVHKMLSKAPSQRFASGRELLADLRAVSPSGQVTPRDPNAVLTTSQELEAPVPTGIVDENAATQQLQALMRTSSVRFKRRRREMIWLAALAVVVFCLAGVIAWAVRPRSLLAGVGHRPLVPKQETAQRQLAWAKLTRTEDALLAVEANFPTAEYQIRRAKQELAMLYVEQDRKKQALPLFEELANLYDEPEFRACGLVGKGLIYALRKDFDRAVATLGELEPLRGKLGKEMQPLLAFTLSYVEGNLSPTKAKEWDEWQHSLPLDPADDDTPDLPGGNTAGKPQR